MFDGLGWSVLFDPSFFWGGGWCMLCLGFLVVLGWLFVVLGGVISCCFGVGLLFVGLRGCWFSFICSFVV